MTKQTKITGTEARFPLAVLTLSDMNPRQNVSEQDIVDLAGSIWAAGLIQNIAGLADKQGKAEIVAGGRRLRALQYLAMQHPDMADTRPDLANPMVMLAPDAATAEVWANMENVARRDLHPAEEIRAYGKMETKGATAAIIARAFAVTENHVYRRLALANLAEPIIEALAAGEINLSMAACFTICDDEKHSLAVLEQVRPQRGVRGDHYSDHQLKNMLKPDSVKGSDRRAKFVGEEAYKEAGGRMGGDLFTEEALFDSPEILDGCFQVALEDAAKKVAEDQGWKWVEAIDRNYICTYSMGLEKFGRVYRIDGELSEYQAERYDELADLANGDALDDAGQTELATLQDIVDGDYTTDQKAHAGAFILVSHSGQLEINGGFIKPEHKRAAIEGGVLRASQHGSETSAEPKSPISQKLADDLGRIATGARQHAALRDPEMILALLAFQLTGKSGYRRPFGLREDTVVNTPTTEAAGFAIDERLTTPASTPKDPWGSDLARGFRAFKAKGMEHITDELTRHLAALLTVDDEKLSDLIDKTVETNVREVWMPNAENFFSRVGGPYLNVLWRDLLDLAEDHPTATTFAKLKKAEKAAKLEALFCDEAVRSALNLTEKQAARIDAWLPECFD